MLVRDWPISRNSLWRRNRLSSVCSSLKHVHIALLLVRLRRIPNGDRTVCLWDAAIGSVLPSLILILRLHFFHHTLDRVECIVKG